MAAIRDEARAAIDLVSKPWSLEVLLATEAGHHPRAVLPPDSDPEDLHAAIQQLTEIGAVLPATAGPEADKALTLTARGEELLRRLHQFDRST